MFTSNSIDRAWSRFMNALDEPAAVQASASPVAAKMEMSAPDICPYCNTKMKVTQCCGQPMYVCKEDRAVFPMEDPAPGG